MATNSLRPGEKALKGSAEEPEHWEDLAGT